MATGIEIFLICKNFKCCTTVLIFIISKSAQNAVACAFIEHIYVASVPDVIQPNVNKDESFECACLSDV